MIAVLVIGGRWRFGVVGKDSRGGCFLINNFGNFLISRKFWELLRNLGVCLEKGFCGKFLWKIWVKVINKNLLGVCRGT